MGTAAKGLGRGLEDTPATMDRKDRAAGASDIKGGRKLQGGMETMHKRLKLMIENWP